MSSFKDKPLKKCHTDKRKMIDELHTEIIENLEDDKINEYFLDNGFLLDQYYRDGTSISSSNDEGGILSFFQKNTVEEDLGDTVNKKSLMNEYMCNIDDTIINQKYKNIQYDKCKLCGSQTHLSDISSELACSECGHTSDIMIVTEKSSYADPPREVSYFSYKRINHFNEWLAQFQAKETTEIPKYIYTDVMDEFKKNINSNINKITYKQVRKILKKLKYNKYYEHIPHIITVIGGNKAPTLLNQYEELLRNMFKEIQIPFMNNCPDDRKNFLSYSYVLHKFCQLLELDELLIHFPLLKSREKLQQQDKIWENICKDLNWQYIASV